MIIYILLSITCKNLSCFLATIDQWCLTDHNGDQDSFWIWICHNSRKIMQKNSMQNNLFHIANCYTIIILNGFATETAKWFACLYFKFIGVANHFLTWLAKNVNHNFRIIVCLATKPAFIVHFYGWLYANVRWSTTTWERRIQNQSRLTQFQPLTCSIWNS